MILEMLSACMQTIGLDRCSIQLAATLNPPNVNTMLYSQKLHVAVANLEGAEPAPPPPFGRRTDAVP